jgi:hypothetical protein
VAAPGRLRDVQCEVAHPLDVARAVDRRDHHPQVGRDRRLQRQQPERLVLRVAAQIVDPDVLGDHLLSELQVGLEQRPGRPLHRGGHLQAHVRERVGEGRELVLVRAPHDTRVETVPPRHDHPREAACPRTQSPRLSEWCVLTDAPARHRAW